MSLCLCDIVVQYDRLFQLTSDGLQRIQAGHRILHYHGNLLTANRQPFFFSLEPGQIYDTFIAAGIVHAEPDGPVVNVAVGVQHAQEGFRKYGFSGA